jgi:putative transposase
MALSRSTYYDAPAEPAIDADILGRMQAICDGLEAYGYRRVAAELRHQGIIGASPATNSKIWVVREAD